MSEEHKTTRVPAEFDRELEQAILFLQDPFGDEPHQSEHLQAAKYLLDHASQAHPRLLGLLQSGQASNPYAVIELLPQFGLPESIPILEELMARGPTNLCQSAAQALAAHTLDEAREVLLRGLRASKKETVIAAADGLMMRGDPLACSGLEKFQTHPDRDVRYHAIQAAASLGCLKHETLFAIARDDRSDDIRELAAQLMKATPNRAANP